MLSSRTLLFIQPKYNSSHLLTPNSQYFPPHSLVVQSYRQANVTALPSPVPHRHHPRPCSIHVRSPAHSGGQREKIHCSSHPDRHRWRALASSGEPDPRWVFQRHLLTNNSQTALTIASHHTRHTRASSPCQFFVLDTREEVSAEPEGTWLKWCLSDRAGLPWWLRR